MDLNYKNMRKILFLIIFTVLFFLAVQNISDVISAFLWLINALMPFILGGCFAFAINVLLNPLELHVLGFMGRSERPLVRRAHRPLSIFLCFLIILAALAVILMLIIPEIARSVRSLAEGFPEFWTDSTKWLQDLLNDWNVSQDALEKLQIDWQSVGTLIANGLEDAGSVLINTTVNAVFAVFSGITRLVMAMVFAAFVLFHKEKIGRIMERVSLAYLTPEHAVSCIALGTMAYDAFARFIKGQFTEALILGMLCFTGMSILGLPYAMMISVVVAFTAIIPIVGPYIGAIFGALITLTVSASSMIWFLVFLILLQQFESNLIYPRVVGKSVGLPGIWVFTGVLLGGALLGLPGMLIGVPVFSIVYCILRESVATRLKKRNLER